MSEMTMITVTVKTPKEKRSLTVGDKINVKDVSQFLFFTETEVSN